MKLLISLPGKLDAVKAAKLAGDNRESKSAETFPNASRIRCAR